MADVNGSPIVAGSIEDIRPGTVFRVPAPGFAVSGTVGLGDLFKMTTAAVGVLPCGNCVKRAEFLNRIIVFEGKNKR